MTKDEGKLHIEFCLRMIYSNRISYCKISHGVDLDISRSEYISWLFDNMQMGRMGDPMDWSGVRYQILDELPEGETYES